MPSLYMLWPDKGPVSAHKVIGWAQDAWNDAAPRRRCSRCGVVTVSCHHDKPVSPVREGEFAANDPNHPHVVSVDNVTGCIGDCDDEPLHEDYIYETCPLSLEDCASYLEDQGLVTFRRR